MDLMRRVCILPDGTPLLKFIARREDVYQGPYITKYPDVVLEFNYGFGVGWGLNVPQITQAASYNLVPGSHRGETGTCFLRTSRTVATDTIDLLDVTPTLLDLMGIGSPTSYDGTSILQHEGEPLRQGSERPRVASGPAPKGRPD